MYRDTDHRPRLELASSSATGPGPLSPAWVPVAAPPEPLSLSPAPDEALKTLEARLEAARAECLAALRVAPPGGPLFIPQSALVSLNADLAAVRQLNAGLMPHRRVGAVAAWPDPVLPVAVLLGVRNLLPYVWPALRIVAAARADLRPLPWATSVPEAICAG